MSIKDIIKHEMDKSHGSARMIKVPENRRPTRESMEKMAREVSAQFEWNEAMRRCRLR